MKKKTPKGRNPVAKAVKHIRPKIKPNKKKSYPVPKDQPSTGEYSYNDAGILGGV